MERQRRNFLTALLETHMRLRGHFSLKYHYLCGRWLAWQLRCLVRYRTDIVMINLARSFPDKKYKELQAICRQFYSRLGDIAAEALWFSGCRGERGRERFRKQNLVTCTNPELLNSYYDAGRSVIVFSSHTGNWELTGAFFEMTGEEPLHIPAGSFAVVYRSLKSRTWDRIFEDNRLSLVPEGGFGGYVESEEILQYVAAHADRPMVYVFPNDQAPYSIALPYNVGLFLHQPTRGMTGGAALARHFAMAVVYMRWRVVRRGHYEVTFVPIAEDASSLRKSEILRRYYSLLEADIEAQPFNYLWTHKRWK